jgi:hypothetical protein
MERKMAKEDARNSVNDRVAVHKKQDQELADRLGNIDPSSGINKLPLSRVTSENSPNVRRETVVKK